jgi:hypothetical protein
MGGGKTTFKHQRTAKSGTNIRTRIAFSRLENALTQILNIAENDIDKSWQQVSEIAREALGLKE